MAWKLLISKLINSFVHEWIWSVAIRLKQVEMPGIEPGAFHMQSERSTTELHPLDDSKLCKTFICT
jgi:hypothetical protein